VLRHFKKLAIVVFVVGSVAAVPAAKADNTDEVTLNFASGATFTGNVDFSSDYSSITGVNGILTGYENGITGYTGIGIDSINWVWGLCGNCSGLSGDQFGNFLMDGMPFGNGFGEYSNVIAFTYDYTNAPALVLDTAGDIGVEVDYDDPLVNGSITPTPEPSTMLLLGSGLLGLAAFVRRKSLQRA
jgi:hypothetical protein